MPSKDPEYQKRYIRKHYLANKDYYKRKTVERKARYQPFLKSFVNRYKLYVGCVDCGYKTHPHALHFDHLKDKRQAIATMVNSVVSLRRIKEEIRKCEVRCANCHAIKTDERRKTDALSS